MITYNVRQEKADNKFEWLLRVNVLQDFTDTRMIRCVPFNLHRRQKKIERKKSNDDKPLLRTAS